jgi:WD40-like Beta Propeller Repeat
VRRHSKATSAGSTIGWGMRRGLLGVVGVCALCLLAFAGSGASSAFAATCANEDIRNSPASNTNPATGNPYSADLPECRAYEKISPDFKNAGQTLLSWHSAPISRDGSTAFWLSQAVFAGAESTNAVFNTYRSSRTSDGWITKSADVPFSVIGTTIPFFLPTAVSADLKSNLVCGEFSPDTWTGVREFVMPYGCAFNDGAGGWIPSAQYRPYTVANNPGGGFPEPLGVSADLRHVVLNDFPGIRYLPQDTAPGTAPTLYELANLGEPDEELRIVNVDNSGKLIGSPTFGGGAGLSEQSYHAISDDGSTIYFTATPTGGVRSVFARVDGETTTAISNPSPPECTSCDLTPKPASFVGASSGGERAFFTTTQQLVDQDDDTTTDLYMYDFEPNDGHHIVQVSAGGPGDASPGSGANVQGVVQTSADGSRAYFLSTDTLTTVPNGNGQIAASGMPNLYMYERSAAFPFGRIRFVATVGFGDLFGLTFFFFNASQAAPDDGRYLVFQVEAALTSDDLDSASDIYRYDSHTGELVRVSTGNSAYPASNDGNTAGMAARIEGSKRWYGWTGAFEGATVSDDGSRIVFTTAEKLQADDTNGGDDIYIWQEGVVALVSPGRTGVPESDFGYMSASGNDVMFETEGQLVPEDEDERNDLYTARVNGGFPYIAPTPPCHDNEACHGRPAAPPAAGQPATADFVGPGNPGTPRACRKGTVRRRGKCVKKPRPRRQKRNHHGRAAR